MKVGEKIIFKKGLIATCIKKLDGKGLLAFSVKGDELDEVLNKIGEMPLPPYIASRRPADAQDHLDYQTVWAKHPGAVAAPTASLHLDEHMLSALSNPVSYTHLTLPTIYSV